MAKKVIIIGGGVSGITSGIYLCYNGYDVEIMDLNGNLGGACTGWERKGNYIDGCIHWLTGTNPKSTYNNLWTDTHAILPNTDIHYQESFGYFDFGNGKFLNLWTDIDKLEDELVSFAPEDVKMIRDFCWLIRRFKRIEGPVHKPVDMMNVFELIKIGFTMVDDFYWATLTSRIDCVEYGKKFKNKYLRQIFDGFMAPGYNLQGLLYMLGHIANRNGGIPIGGSKAMVDRMVEYYKLLGGRVRTRVEVSEILVENGTAKGVRLKNGEEEYADWIISAVPAETCFKDLLRGKYHPRFLEERIADGKKYPIYTYTSVVFKCKRKDLSSEPTGRQIYFDPIRFDKDYSQLSIRNYAYDTTLKSEDGSIVVQANILGDDDMYFYWKSVRENGDYKEKKRAIAEKILEIIEEKVPAYKGTLEIIDVVTPLTYERYLHSRHGTFQGFVHTRTGKILMQSGKIPGIRNFILSGQWIFYSGGLPPAAITGRFAAQRICRADRVPFAAPHKTGFRIPDALRGRAINK